MKYIIMLVLLCVASTTFAQIRIEGAVNDSIGNPLELVNVIAINQETKSLESFGISNDLGYYKLSLKKNTAYKLQVSYIGMKTYEEILETKETDIVRDISLLPDNMLDEVELIYEMPVSIKGDTLIYNADSFTNGTEKKLEDVLKKLPGVEINDDGQIEVEGKEVSKLMVNGKDFFDGDSKLATKNIPADAVDKIEVLKNFGEVGQLRGVQNNQDNVAINIKLKEGKSNFWFGDVTVGGGFYKDKGLFLAQPKLFYYNPKYSINIIADANNVGETAFTRRDYFNFTGGFRNVSSNSGTNISLGNNNLGFLTMRNNRAKSIDTKFGAANFSYSPNKSLTLSGFAIYSGTKTDMQENSDVIYTDSGFDIPDENTESKTQQRSDLGLLKLSASYKPNGNSQLDYDIYGRVSKETEDQSFLSSVLGGVTQFQEQEPYSINQNLNYYYTLNEVNIFAIEVQHLWQDENPFYNAIIEQNNAYQNTGDNLGFNGAQLGYNIGQDKRVKSNKLDAKIDYWNVLNKKSNINLTMGTIHSNQKFSSEIFQTLDNGNQLAPIPLGGVNVNDVNYTFNDYYLGFHYNLKAGKFTLTPGFSAHVYNTKNTQLNSSYSDDFIRVLPDFNVRLQIKRSENVNLRYNMQTDFTDVSRLAAGFVLNNYNSIFSGNRELENALSHNINASYFSFNMFNFTNIFAYINYNKRINSIRNQANFESVIQSSIPFNSDFADETISVNGRFERTFGKIKASVGANVSFSKYNQIINNEQSINEIFTHTYMSKLRTNFKNAPNIEAGYNLSIKDNNQGGRTTKFYTHSPFINFDALILKNFTFIADYSYNNFKNNETTINSYSFMDTSLTYQKKDSKWEYKLGITNFFDAKLLSQSNTSSISVSSNEYFIQPRYTVFSMKYNL